MERLSPWRPLLVGGVAAGWATAHSDVRLELEAEDPKAVELGLINAGIEYTAAAPASGTVPGARLNAGRGAVAVRLDIVSPQQRRNRSRRNDEERLSLADLKSLLADAASAADSS
jgi:hypothetical protein